MSMHLSYEVKVFATSPQVEELLERFPQARASLFTDGVPAGFIGRRYSVNKELRIIHVDGSSPVVRFGSTGLQGAIGLSSETGAVVEVIDEQLAQLLFVNSSLPQFTKTVRTITARFPFYGRDASAEEFEEVASELLEVIRGIDPEAAVPDRYWSTFTDDVAIGDLSNETIDAIGK